MLDPRIYCDAAPELPVRRYPSNNLSGLGDTLDTLGGKVWEWLHPEQVRGEYEAVGKEPAPDVEFSDVLTTAYEQARETAREAGAHLSTGLALAKNALIIGAALYAVHLLVQLRRK